MHIETNMTEILVVDDDKSFLKSMVLGLKSIAPSLSVLSAENGLEAVELLKRNCICLLVTDLKMPEMDGFELLAYVMEHYPDISVVVTTGHSIPDAQSEALHEAALIVLFKPFSLQDLTLTVSQLLEKQADGGTLFNVSPGTFMQLINMEQKTCTLRIQEKTSGQMGVLFFREGQLLDARMGDQQGEAASLEIFSWDHISLSIQNDCSLHDRKITRSMNALILEATRLKDENADKTIVAKSTAAPNTSTNRTEGDQGNNKLEKAHEKQLTETDDRLQNNPELNGFIQNISHDQRWDSVLSQLTHVGKRLRTGNLKAFSIITGSVLNYVIIPSNPPTVLTVQSKCPKEKLYQALG
jgi:CheY-like chemotaxis protein